MKAAQIIHFEDPWLPSPVKPIERGPRRIDAFRTQAEGGPVVGRHFELAVASLEKPIPLGILE